MDDQPDGMPIKDRNRISHVEGEHGLEKIVGQAREPPAVGPTLIETSHERVPPVEVLAISRKQQHLGEGGNIGARKGSSETFKRGFDALLTKPLREALARGCRRVHAVKKREV